MRTRCRNEQASRFQYGFNFDFRVDLTALERAEQIAERVKLTGEKQSAQVGPKGPVGHCPQGGINAAVRDHGIDRTEAQRAVKLSSLSDDAMQAEQ